MQCVARIHDLKLVKRVVVKEASELCSPLGGALAYRNSCPLAHRWDDKSAGEREKKRVCSRHRCLNVIQSSFNESEEREG